LVVKNGSNIRALTCGAMPLPVSRMLNLGAVVAAEFPGGRT
jgi:hypothetical protein